jgi:hypothetical protein
MDNFEKKTVDSFPCTEMVAWFDVYSNWPHSQDSLINFTNHFNNQSESIIFTVKKREKRLPYLLGCSHHEEA